MKYNKVLLTALYSFFMGMQWSVAQTNDDPVAVLINKLNESLGAHLQEKVYLHLDKAYYAAGEDIWFKAYLVAGGAHKPSAISGVLNVDLIDEHEIVKKSIKLPVDKGVAWGDFSLSDTMQAGNYRIRAYTRWMRNSGEAWFYDQHIVIGNAAVDTVFTKTNFTYDNQHRLATATITYSDLMGKPFKGTKANYTVTAGSGSIGFGSGETDEKGQMSINFSGLDPKSHAGAIVTHLKIVNKKQTTSTVLINALTNKVDVQFFPEGGALINGSNSKVAFKALSPDGMGANVKGVITDDLGTQVAAFSSSHSGMGLFYFTPRAGHVYKAMVTDYGGTMLPVNFPFAVNTGYLLAIDNSAETYVKVKVSLVNPPAGSSIVSLPVTLLAQTGGTIYYEGKSTPGNNDFSATIPKSKFPSGVVQFTLFSATGDPINERLVFIRNPDQLTVDVITARSSYSPRGKVKVDLKVHDKDNKPVIANLSVAVTDESKVPADEIAENTIMSNLLLTSDVKGYVEQPGYYFKDNSEQTRADLDLLMLTQGYHRFNWKKLEHNGYSTEKFPPEKSLSISGLLTTDGGQPVINGKVSVLNSQSSIFLVNTTTDSNGRFAFKDLVYRDSVRFLITGSTASGGKNVKLLLDKITPPLNADATKAPLLDEISGDMVPFLVNSKNSYQNDIKFGLKDHSITLKEVFINENRVVNSRVKNSSNLNGPGKADNVITAEDMYKSACPTIIDCLRMDINISMVPNGNHDLVPNMLVIMDGATVYNGASDSNSDFIKSLNVNDIESIEVLRTANLVSIYGSRGYNGVLIITSKRGDSKPVYDETSTNIATYQPRGYYLAREFYSPAYDKPQVNKNIPDLRSTIYWNPNLFTAPDGKASFTFFNADGKGTYRVVVEGIDADGRLARQVFNYIVTPESSGSN